jgi:hypothetical protein
MREFVSHCAGISAMRQTCYRVCPDACSIQVDEVPMRAMALQSALSEMPNDVSLLPFCYSFLSGYLGHPRQDTQMQQASNLMQMNVWLMQRARAQFYDVVETVSIIFILTHSVSTMHCVVFFVPTHARA